jgi:hypothetical protein
VPTLEAHSETRIIHYAYDAQNRIIDQTDSLFFDTNEFNVAYHSVYQYDNKGNLINGLTYDDKINIRRTNKIWMFLKRDYSVNNAFVATKYNSFGLPETYHTGYNDLALNFVLPGTNQVEYSCH